MAARALAALAPYDAVLTPTLASPPLPVGAIRDDDDPAGRLRGPEAVHAVHLDVERHRQPGVSLPTHWTPDGLPVGVMLAARPGDEATLLSLAAQVEQAHADAGTPWRDRRPPCW